MWKGSKRAREQGDGHAGSFSVVSGIVAAGPAGFDQRDERTAVAVLAADEEAPGHLDGRGRLQHGEVGLAADRAATASRRRSRAGRRGRGRSACPASRARNSRTSARTTRTPGEAANPVESRLARMAATARRSASTKHTDAAPRDSASIPSAPEPANASSTEAPSTAPRLARMSKIASRTRSLVGRRPGDVGSSQLAPLRRAADDARIDHVDRAGPPDRGWADRDRSRLGSTGDRGAWRRRLSSSSRNSSSSSATNRWTSSASSGMGLEGRVRVDDRLGHLRGPPGRAPCPGASEARRRSLRPFWRIPKHGALAAQLEVDLGQLEPVAGRLERPQAPRRPARHHARRAGSTRTCRSPGRPGPAAGAAGRCRSGRRPRSPSPSRSPRRRRPR